MLAAGMAAGWAYKCWPEALAVSGEPAAHPALVIACLADAHLRDGSDQRLEARSLARAVAEIKALKPTPDLVFFAGDLAHEGHPKALALGREILAELPMPVLAVRGEGDGDLRGAAGRQLFRGGRFFYTCQGVNLLGLDTAWQHEPRGPGFVLGGPQQRWLAEVLPRLDPAAPLIVLSHAPLAPIYRPWGQWTRDSGPWLDRLADFHNVTYVHGHVHHAEGTAANTLNIPAPNDRLSRELKTAHRQPPHLALPATSWPLPSPLTGTPRELRPGLGPRGCGWALWQSGSPGSQFRQVLWQA